MCFAPILLAYDPLLMFGEVLARDAMLPHSMVWLVKEVLLIAGIVMLQKQLCT
ncbi:MAG: hypothetical protein MK179_19375 [Pirellulaceae bacterium]|nr:hypothetical protein [Pirellulaceae bacterium]